MKMCVRLKICVWQSVKLECKRECIHEKVSVKKSAQEKV